MQLSCFVDVTIIDVALFCIEGSEIDVAIDIIKIIILHTYMLKHCHECFTQNKVLRPHAKHLILREARTL